MMCCWTASTIILRQKPAASPLGDRVHAIGGRGGEFKVKTNNFSAEFGHSAGQWSAPRSSQVETAFTAACGSFCATSNSTPITFFLERQPHCAPAIQNRIQFGGTFSGPVTIPKLYSGKNRTFFFFDYEKTTRRTSASSSTLDCSRDFRGAIFSAYNQADLRSGRATHRPAGTVSSTVFSEQHDPRHADQRSSAAISGSSDPNAERWRSGRTFIRLAPRPYDNGH